MGRKKEGKRICAVAALRARLPIPKFHAEEILSEYVEKVAVRLCYSAYLNAPREPDTAKRLAPVYLQAGHFLFGHPTRKAINDSEVDGHPRPGVISWIRENVDTLVKGSTFWDVWRSRLNDDLRSAQISMGMFSRDCWFLAFREISIGLMGVDASPPSLAQFNKYINGVEQWLTIPILGDPIREVTIRVLFPLPEPA